MAEKRKPGFQKGVSGNPKGKPKGARHKVTMAVEALFDNEAEVLSRKAIELAKEGDLTALRLCLDRICPPKKERSIYFDAPDLKTPADALAVIAAIARGLADGELTPGEAASFFSIRFCRTSSQSNAAYSSSTSASCTPSSSAKVVVVHNRVAASFELG